LLGELGGLLEFLVLRLVLFKDRDKLPFFLDAFDRLLLVLLDLVLNLLSLVVDLLIECLLDAHVQFLCSSSEAIVVLRSSRFSSSSFGSYCL